VTDVGSHAQLSRRLVSSSLWTSDNNGMDYFYHPARIVAVLPMIMVGIKRRNRGSRFAVSSRNKMWPENTHCGLYRLNVLFTNVTVRHSSSILLVVAMVTRQSPQPAHSGQDETPNAERSSSTYSFVAEYPAITGEVTCLGDRSTSAPAEDVAQSQPRIGDQLVSCIINFLLPGPRSR